MKRVPVLVVSGFLGSGKTTLVRHLLRDAQQQGVRAAVISNEFGELGIDSALLGAGTGAFVELAGGCVCCQLSGELVDTLELLRRTVDPDRVIVETSGVALPYDTQLHFWREPVSDWIEDDVAVVVVNAEQLLAERALSGTFEDQVSSADLLVLNKLDLVPAQAIADLQARLAKLAPGIPVLDAVQAEVAPAVLFPPDPEGLREQRRKQAVPRPHSHEQFRAEEMQVEADIAPGVLEQRIRAAGALRVKGFVATSIGLRLVQAVGPRIELAPVDAAPAPEVIGRLVLIHAG